MTRILITPRSLTSAQPPELVPLQDAGYELVFTTPGRTPDEAELISVVPGCVGWLAGVEPVSESVIEAAEDLKVISRNGTGVDNLPGKAIAERGITVLRALGANASGVTELTVGLIIAHLRHLVKTVNGVNKGGWTRIRGKEIAGSRVGVIGMGAVGRRVAVALSALGAKVIAYDPLEPKIAGFEVDYLSMEQLFATANIITLHCPMPADGRPLINETTIKSMVDGVLIVNTARAALVDDTAIVQALETGKISGYATDVFSEEPPSNLAVCGHEKVIGTSHIGGFTDRCVSRATEIAVSQLLTALKG